MRAVWLGIVLVLGILTHTDQSGGVWILAVILMAMVVRIILLVFVPVEFEPGRAGSYKPPYLVFVAGSAVSLFVVEFVGMGWFAVIVGASRQEIGEHLEILSLPLGLVSHAFLIRPDKSFLDVCGIIAGNSFFYGLLLWICYSIVRRAFDRNRITQIHISDSEREDL